MTEWSLICCHVMQDATADEGALCAAARQSVCALHVFKSKRLAAGGPLNNGFNNSYVVRLAALVSIVSRPHAVGSGIAETAITVMR